MMNNGSVLVADSFNNRIRKLTLLSSTTTPVIYNVTTTSRSTGAATAQVNLSLDFFDSDRDITYSGSATGSAVVKITDPARSNCSDILYGAPVNKPGQQSGTITLFANYTWGSKKTSSAPFPIQVTLTDAAGHESAPVQVLTSEIYMISVCQ